MNDMCFIFHLYHATVHKLKPSIGKLVILELGNLGPWTKGPKIQGPLILPHPELSTTSYAVIIDICMAMMKTVRYTLESCGNVACVIG